MARPKLIRIEELSDHFAPLFYKEAGQRLEFWRKSKGLDLVHASRLLRTSSSTLAFVERGLRRFGLDITFGRFVEAVGGMDTALWIVLGTGKAPVTLAQYQADHKARQKEAREKAWASRVQKLLDRGYSERYVAMTHPAGYEHYLRLKNQTGAVKPEGEDGDK
jgi:hypothetical protein